MTQSVVRRVEKTATMRVRFTGLEGRDAGDAELLRKRVEAISWDQLSQVTVLSVGVAKARRAKKQVHLGDGQ